MTKPAKRAQQSMDDRADYERQRRTFEGAPDIATKPASPEYRANFDKIDWTNRKESRP